MTRARRPTVHLYRRFGIYTLNVLLFTWQYDLFVPFAAAVRAALWASGVTLPLPLGRDPRTARRRLRALLRSWGWPGADVRTACAWVGRDRPAFISWPWVAAQGDVVTSVFLTVTRKD